MTSHTPANQAAAEWRRSRLLCSLYSALAGEFSIELQPCAELDAHADTPTREDLEAARKWFQEMDDRIPVHQLRQFLQTSSRANQEALAAALEHYLHKPERGTLDRDKIDFLLVQFFTICAPSRLENNEVTLEFVARILEPVLGGAEATVSESLRPLEGLANGANDCHSLQELFNSGVLESGRKLKLAQGDDYYNPSALLAFTQFNFLLRRAFFRLMHRDLNAIMDGLRQLELRGITTLDCRRAEFAEDEPTSRLRMICQSWKVMFQAEYAFGQPLRLLADLRVAVDERLRPESQDASQTGAPARAQAAAASGGSGSVTSDSVDDGSDSNSNSNSND